MCSPIKHPAIPSSGSIAAAYPGNVTAGSLGVACVVADNIAGTTVSGVAGSSSGSWAQAVHAELAGDQILDIWYKENMAGGADTITATYNAAKSARRIVIAEYSGVATSSALDKVDSNVQTPTSTSTDATTSTAQTTTTANQLIVGCVHVLDGTARGVTAGTGFTERQDTNNDAQVSLEDRVEASPTSVAATFTLNAAVNTITALATFKEAAGGAGPVRSLMMMGVGM